MKEDEMLDKLSSAIATGDVVVLKAGPAVGDATLVVDETGTIVSLVRKTNWSDEAFGLRIEDGGGFTGLVLTPAQWTELKTKVDNFLEERTYNKT